MITEKTTCTETELYGKDAAEWLQRWDLGWPVWSISMGGVGPGYEQVIQILTAEMVRFYLEHQVEMVGLKLEDGDWKRIAEMRDQWLFAKPEIKKVGCSGAQVGAAASLAYHIFINGPAAVMADKEVKDRHIQVKKDFP